MSFLNYLSKFRMRNKKDDLKELEIIDDINQTGKDGGLPLQSTEEQADMCGCGHNNCGCNH